MNESHPRGHTQTWDTPSNLLKRGRHLIHNGKAAEARSLIALAAERGHVDANVELGRMHAYGIGGPVDSIAAKRHFKSATDVGSPAGSYYSALLSLSSGDEAGAESMLQGSAEAGYTPALRSWAIQLGAQDEPIKQALAVAAFKRAAALGDASSALLLAERLARGEGCTQDFGRATVLRNQLALNGISPLPPLSTPQSYQTQVPETLSERPLVRVRNSTLSADECRLVIATARQFLRRSLTVTPDGKPATAQEIRTSSSATLDPLAEDFAIHSAMRRTAKAFDLDLARSEWLSVLKYQPGQEYRLHRDYLPPSALTQSKPEAGNRSHTICIYLNDGYEGGETHFPVASLKIQPQAGSAICFENMHNGIPDPDSLHAGLPVKLGEKWLATLWIRERQYRPW